MASVATTSWTQKLTSCPDCVLGKESRSHLLKSSERIQFRSLAASNWRGSPTTYSDRSSVSRHFLFRCTLFCSFLCNNVYCIVPLFSISTLVVLGEICMSLLYLYEIIVCWVVNLIDKVVFRDVYFESRCKTVEVRSCNIVVKRSMIPQ